MDVLRVITLVLLIIGGLNWGLIGLFGVDIVAAIFGTNTLFTRLIYILVGASAIVQAVIPENWATSRNRVVTTRSDLP